MWYFEENGKSAGPVADSDIQGLVSSGRLFPHTRVWREGMIDWQPADRSELSSLFSNAPPPLYRDVARPGFLRELGEVRYAGFWIRLFAYAIDFVIMEVAVVVAAFAIGFVIGLVYYASGNKSDPDVLRGFGVVIGLVGQVMYFCLIPAGPWQATPGKRIVGIHIVRTDGQRLSSVLALGRYLSYIPSSLIFGIGFFMIGWTDQKQGLHDMICKTRVVYGKT